jgi:6-phosphogluconolactonase
VNLVVADDLPAEGAAFLGSALAGGGSIALAGGSTPRPVYQRLELPWDKVDLYFGDERDHEDTNWRMAGDVLLQRVPARAHRMPAERGLDGASEYAAILPDVLDVVVLGMGDDLHTASLFPLDAALASTDKVAFVPMSPTSPRCPRLTITPAVIAAARTVVVLVAGASKAGPLVTALRGEYDPLRFPVQLARGGTWIVDRAAAANL